MVEKKYDEVRARWWTISMRWGQGAVESLLRKSCGCSSPFFGAVESLLRKSCGCSSPFFGAFVLVPRLTTARRLLAHHLMWRVPLFCAARQGQDGQPGRLAPGSASARRPGHDQLLTYQAGLSAWPGPALLVVKLHACDQLIGFGKWLHMPTHRPMSLGDLLLACTPFAACLSCSLCNFGLGHLCFLHRWWLSQATSSRANLRTCRH